MPIAKEFLGYTPPILKKTASRGEHIEYNVFNPVTMKMERQRIRLEKLSRQFKNRTQYKQQVMQLMMNLTGKLAGGWTPYGETQNVAEYTPINRAIEAYIADKSRDLRQASMVSYKSVADIFVDWLTAQSIHEMASYLVTQRICQRFMDELRDRPKFNNNTYNTYLKKYRAAFNWLKEHEYVNDNPFDQIKTLQKQEKMRGLIPPEARDIVIKYVRASKFPNYEVVMHLVFTSLIRPSEIERIQIKDIDLRNKCIHIPASKAKTHKDRDAALSDACIAMLIPMLAKPDVQADWYLINSSYECGPAPCYHSMFKKHWMKIRKDCGLPDEMQLYSLKDTGITEMLEAGVDIVAVKEAAGHADISTTNKYIGKRTERMIEEVRGADVSLGTKKTNVKKAEQQAGHPDMSVTKEYESDDAKLKEKMSLTKVAI